MGIILYRIEKLFNSAEINVKRGKCWYRKGQFHYFSKQRTWGDLLNIKSMSASCFLIHNTPLNSMAHKQWSWSLHSYEETYSSLVTNSAPLHILLYSSGHLNINDNGFCFKISMDPTAMILIRGEKFEGWGRAHKFRIGYPKFSIHPFHSFFPQYEAFSILWQLQIFNLSSIFKSLHCQGFKSWKSRDYQLLCWQTLALWMKWCWVKKNQYLFFLLLLKDKCTTLKANAM